MTEASDASQGLRAEIVTTGTEILLGEIVDTNAAWIAQQLRDAGVNLYYKSTVGDNQARVCSLLELALSRSDVIIVSGGLGPTKDDITRHAIAEATGCPLVQDEAAVTALRERFARFGSKMTENNLQQALIPQGATLIRNPVGTAPGFIVETERGTIIALPGVPREMKHLMTETVLPYLRGRGGNQGVIRRRVLRTMGIGESTLDDRLDELMLQANPTVGLAAHTAQCDIRIAARATTVAEADRLLDQLEAKVRERVGSHIYSNVPEEALESVVSRMLAQGDRKLALLESNTQGQVGLRLVQTDEGSSVVRARYLASDDNLPNGVKELLGRSNAEQPTEALARQCAEVLRVESGCDLALVLLGTKDQAGGVYGDADGETWIALASENTLASTHVAFGGSEAVTVTRLGNHALGVLWQTIRT